MARDRKNSTVKPGERTPGDPDGVLDDEFRDEEDDLFAAQAGREDKYRKQTEGWNPSVVREDHNASPYATHDQIWGRLVDAARRAFLRHPGKREPIL